MSNKQVPSFLPSLINVKKNTIDTLILSITNNRDTLINVEKTPLTLTLILPRIKSSETCKLLSKSRAAFCNRSEPSNSELRYY